MRIGFTGTQKGMTEIQKKEVALILLYHSACYNSHSNEPLEAHHGDCIGADVQFHEFAQEYHYITIAHPASNTGNKRAFCKADLVLPEEPALIRNHHIVDLSDIMIATPKQNHDVLRSGTWATIRYCKKVGKIVHVIYPF